MPGYAIVGMGCRFPGAPSLDAFWDLLCRGGDGIIEIPSERMDIERLYHPEPGRPGTMNTRWAGLLPDLDLFDPEPFGISAREAHHMDPQQRIVLEVTSEALQDAGIAPASLRGSGTGVFVGASSFEHASVAIGPGRDLSTYLTTGSVLSVIANRVSYVLDLHGPSMVLDTACSSSLVALSAAVDALRAGTCDLALVGGVNALLNPEMTVSFSQGGFMAPDGRCKPFDHRADGYVRSEGAGVLVLKREADARADEDRVYALVSAVGINQDGRSNGLFAPNGRRQEQLLRSVYHAAGVEPSEVDYLEAHGTGTALGDPIEFGAIAAVLGPGRKPGNELRLGSVKSNIGHLEAGAGVAGVIKAALAMTHGRLPATIHYERPNPHLRLGHHPVVVQQELTAWPDPGQQGKDRVVGVSSFGFGGTNAHAVLRRPAPAPASPASSGVPATGGGRPHPAAPHLVPLAARSPRALRATARAWSEWLGVAEPSVSLADVAATAGARRDHPAHRAAVLAHDVREAAAAFAALATDGEHPALLGTGRVPARAPRLTMAFTGRGDHWPQMVEPLARAFPAYADAYASACREIAAVMPDSAVSCRGGLTAEPAGRSGAAADGPEQRRERDDDQGGAPRSGARAGRMRAQAPALPTTLLRMAAQLAVVRTWAAWGVRPSAVLGIGTGEVVAACVAGELTLPEGVTLLHTASADSPSMPSMPSMPSIPSIPEAVASRGGRAGASQPDTTCVTTRRVPLWSVHAGGWLRAADLGPQHWADCLAADPSVPTAVPDGPSLGMLLEITNGPSLLNPAAEVNGTRPWPPLGRDAAQENPRGALLEVLARLYLAGISPVWPGGGRAALPTHRWSHQRFPLAVRRSPATAATSRDAASTTGAEPSEATAPALNVRGTPAGSPPGPAEPGAVSAGTAPGAPVGPPGADGPNSAVDAPGAAGPIGTAGPTGHSHSTRRTAPRGAPTMPDRTEPDQPLTPAVRSLLEGARHRIADLESRGARLQRQLDASRSDRLVQREPVAVLGMGLRLPPDIATAERLWSFLCEGGDGVGRLDRATDGRRNNRPGDAWRPAGRLEAIDGFDAGFFAVQPEEARLMDPQQRLVLETAWEALEDAGIDAHRLRDSATGVFVGAYTNDYLTLQARSGLRPNVYTATGVSHTVIANRLSYHMSLRGPSLAVDTACSSSLTALHLACRALQAGDCDYAFVGGVNAILDPYSTEMTESVLPFATSARCLSYEEGADGIVRGEGCGVLLLARASVAEQAGVPVRAVIRGSAANQDGRTNGLTAPSPRGQREVLRRALEDAGLTGGDLDYVEGHGTGTALGDPLETDALTAVHGLGDKPCVLGSVKANLGHLESAAGVTGVIKTLLVLEHGHVPAQPRFTRPNPGVELDGTRLLLADAARDLPLGRRLAGVSSFGFGGSNAHVVLEHDPARHAVPAADAAPPAAPGTNAAEETPPSLLLPVSARSEAALVELAESYAALLDNASLQDTRRLCAAAMHRRTHHPVRAAFTGRTPEALRTALTTPRPRSEPGTARATTTAPQVVLVFTGQGSQWPGMAAGLLADPVAAAELRECDAVVREVAGWSLLEEAIAPEGRDRMATTEVAQLSVAAVQLALAARLCTLDVQPAAVLGHSMGELPAAVVAGALDRAEMFRILRTRGRLIEAAAGGGRMVSVAMSEHEVRALLQRHDKVDVAAVNGPHSVVISGLTAAIEGVCQELARDKVRHTLLPVEYAFHSPLLDGADAQLATRIADVAFRPPALPFHSTVTGEPETVLDATYWGRNLRRAVRFADALASLPDPADTLVVEVGPHAVLSGEILRGAEHGGPEFAARPVPLMRRGQGAAATVTAAVGRLYEAGHPIDFGQFAAPPAGRVTLPSYPWQRTRYWLEDPSPAAPGLPAAATQSEETSAPTTAPESDELVAVMRRALADALDLDLEQIAADTVLADWDIESLVIVEVRNQLGRHFDATFPLSVFFTANTLAEIACRLLADTSGGATGTAPDAETERILGNLENMTNSEVEAMIARIEGTDG